MNTTTTTTTSTYEIFSILENKFLFGGYDDVDYSSCGRVRILSIDGGNGVLSAKALLHLESTLRTKSGNPNAHLADFFDVVAGSGVGGILAALLFTSSSNNVPLLTADESLKFILDNHKYIHNYPSKSSKSSLLFGKSSNKSSSSKYAKTLEKVFGDSTLKNTIKPVLIPCYDLATGAPFLFSRAGALFEMGDFKMSGVCKATTASSMTKPVELKSTDGKTKVVALGGRVAMNNPTAAAITHVLNNKQEFPFCKGVEDLLVVSIGNGEETNLLEYEKNSKISSLLVSIAGDGAADMVDQAVSMAFGDELRRKNYFRIQGRVNTSRGERSCRELMMTADEMLGQKSVESVLFKGKKLVEKTNIDKLEILAGELMKEQEIIKKMKNYSSPRSSSATTVSTLSSS